MIAKPTRARSGNDGARAALVSTINTLSPQGTGMGFLFFIREKYANAGP